MLALTIPASGFQAEPRGEVPTPAPVAGMKATPPVRADTGRTGRGSHRPWGSSFSGGHARSRRVRSIRAFAALCPRCRSWPGGDLIAGRDDADEFVALLVAERERRFAGGEPTMLSVTAKAPELPCAFPGSAADRFFDAEKFKSWANAVTLSSFEHAG